MVWVIVLIWVLVVVAFIVYVLRLARGESANRAFSQSLNERVFRGAGRRREDRLPRIGGGRLSFIPNPDGSAEDSEEGGTGSIKCPVYVNSASVVEMRALLSSDFTDEIELWQTNEGNLVTPLKPHTDDGFEGFIVEESAQAGEPVAVTSDVIPAVGPTA